MDFAGTRRFAALGIASAALLAAAFAPAASAAPGIATNRALTAPAGASSSQAEQGMTIEFTRGIAQVAGPGALVNVKCEGTGSRSCVGTLSIEAPGAAPEVPFSLDRGEERVVIVPLGDQRSVFDGIVSVKSRVIAHTVQPTGESVRTARTLRFK